MPWGLVSVAWPCDQCVSTVLYDGCPKSLKAGVWWPQTKFGFSAAVLCPKGSLGEWRMWWRGEEAAWPSYSSPGNITRFLHYPSPIQLGLAFGRRKLEEKVP